MQTKELMSREPRAVRMSERLDAAARVLWDQDCGICPVVDGIGVLVGVVTDRDLCMAAYTQGKVLADIPVMAAMARAVRTCRPEDSVAVLLQTMQQAQVHRLPVVDSRGLLVGIVSTNDLVRAANSRPAVVDAAAVVKVLAAIGAPRVLAATTRATTVAPAVAVAPASKPAIAVAAAAAPAPTPTAAPAAVAAAPVATALPISKPAAAVVAAPTTKTTVVEKAVVAPVAAAASAKGGKYPAKKLGEKSKDKSKGKKG